MAFMEYTAPGASKPMSTWAALECSGYRKSPFHFPCISTHGKYLECSSQFWPPCTSNNGCAGMRLVDATSGQRVRALDLQEKSEQVMVVQPEKENPMGKYYC